MSKTATLLLLCTTLFAQQKGTFTDMRDGKIYKTVKIGEQVWMAENLNYETEGSKCYDNKQVNCDKYGRLYNWETAKKACPSGWHLPDTTEWKVLTEMVGGNETAGKYLKAANGWNDFGRISGNGEDKYGFSALPGGTSYYSSGYFNGIGYYGSWWSTSNGYGYYAYAGYDSYYGQYEEYSIYRDFLFSVRCLQNSPTPPKGEAK